MLFYMLKTEKFWVTKNFLKNIRGNIPVPMTGGGCQETRGTLGSPLVRRVAWEVAGITCQAHTKNGASRCGLVLELLPVMLGDR